jgi:hypothetical protein
MVMQELLIILMALRSGRGGGGYYDETHTYPSAKL